MANLQTMLLKFFGDIGEFLAVIFKSALQQELKLALPIALEAVKQIAADPTIVNSGSKRDTAVALIVARLASQQVQIGISVVNLAVELSYQKFLSEQPAAPAAK